MSLAALRVRFPVSSGGLYVSMSDKTEAEPLGRNWYAFLTAGRNSCVLSHSKTHRGLILCINIFSVDIKFGFLPNGIIQNHLCSGDTG